MISFRNLLATDIDVALKLCRAAGWNQREEDWKLFLNYCPAGCRVCLDDASNVVGTVTFMPYEDRFGWIGMLLVDPEARRQGVGSALLKEGLRLGGPGFTVRLDATPDGRQVYTKLGFRDEYALMRMVRTGPGSCNASSSAAFPMAQQDLVAIKAMDREIFGADRSGLLQGIYALAPSLCSTIMDGANQVIAYCLGRYGYSYTHIGPVIARKRSDAIELVARTLNSAASNSFIIDIPTFDEDWKAWLLSQGFVEQRPFTRMAYGENSFSRLPTNQYAILGPEFG